MSNVARFSLSPLDQSLGIGTPALYRLFCLKRKPDLEILARSLELALSHYPRFASRIVSQDDGYSRLVPLEEPVPIHLRPEIEWSVSDFAMDQVPFFVRDLASRNGGPVLSVTLTPVSQGAVLGVSCSHSVGDMYSYFRFHEYWSRCCHFLSDSSTPASHHSLPSARVDVCNLGSSSFDFPVKQTSRPDIDKGYAAIPLPPDLLEELRYEFSDGGAHYSLNEVVTAYVVHRHSHRLSPGSAPRLRIPINLRGLHPSLGDDFIGNAIIECVVPIVDISDNRKAALETAGHIRRSVLAAKRPESIRANVVVDDDGVHAPSGECDAYNSDTDLLCTNTSRMSFHLIDFGCGAPTDVLGVSYRGLRIASVESGLIAHLRWV